MTCQDVSFSQGRCRVRWNAKSAPGIVVARISIVGDDRETTYLERRLGPKAEPEFDCVPLSAPRHGEPFVMEYS